MNACSYKRLCTSLIVAVLLLGVVSHTVAATWNGSVSSNWFDPNNWTPASVPGDGSDVVIGSGKSVVLSNATAKLNSLDLTGTLTFTNWYAALWVTNATIQSNGIMKCPAPFRDAEMSNQVYLVCSNLDIKAGGKIDVSGAGWRGGESNAVYFHSDGYGPGGGKSDTSNPRLRGGGGGYGGRGGDSTGGAGAFGGGPYGTNSPPLFPGSGGAARTLDAPGYAGVGGGLVQIEASGTVSVNGQILANGTSPTGGDSDGGGSGGGIHINCRTFAEAGGSLRANGLLGDIHGGGGGGGRIAILFTNYYNSSATFQVNPGLWYGGMGQSGQTGTVYIAYSGSDGLLTVTGTPSKIGSPTPYTYGISSVPVGSQVTNTVSSPVIVGSVGYQCAGWTVTSNGTTVFSGGTTQAVFQMTYTNLVLTWGWNISYYLTVIAAPGGSVSNVTGWYTNGQPVSFGASGTGGYTFCQWMGDIPFGQESSNLTTLAIDQPRILVAAFDSPSPTTLTWASGAGNWTNWANWSPAGIPAGPNSRAVISGGSVLLSDPMRLNALTLTNAAVLTFSNGTDAATLQVDGSLNLSSTGRLYVYAGTTNPPSRDWGALVSVGGTMTVASNSWVYPYSERYSGGSPLFRVGNLTVVGPSGGFDANNAGYVGGGSGHTAGYGPGGGGGGNPPNLSPMRGGGGGHGGKGGAGSDCSGSTSYGFGGATNDSLQMPIAPGSGGGAKSDGTAGGVGGGLIRIEAGNRITLDGTLRANGANGNPDSSAGGSGGGIYLTCRSLSGTMATLFAKGGAGSTLGGGGGGGRIAIWSMGDSSATNGWAISVTGGTASSGSPGLDGTIFWGHLRIPGTVIIVQ